MWNELALKLRVNRETHLGEVTEASLLLRYFDLYPDSNFMIVTFQAFFDFTILYYFTSIVVEL